VRCGVVRLSNKPLDLPNNRIETPKWEGVVIPV